MTKVGIQIQCPFSFYYPDLFQKYFKSGKKFHEYSSYQLKGLHEELQKRQPELLDKLNKVSKQNNLTRGQDRYWQFVFPPEDDCYRHYQTIKVLLNENLLPLETPLSVHFTISGIDRDRAYAILFFLELKYLTKERVLEGFSNQHFMPAWGKKLCKTGLLEKDSSKLINAKKAYQLRILKLKMSDMSNVFNDLNKHISNCIIIEEAKSKCKELGLQWKPWNKEDFIKFTDHLEKNN